MLYSAHTVQDNVPNRVNNIKNALGFTNTAQSVFNLPYNSAVGDYYKQSSGTKIYR